MTVGDLEHDLENTLHYVREMESRGQLAPELRPLLLLAPIDGTSVHVSLRHRDVARQIRRNHGAQAFTQREGAVWIVFESPFSDARDEHANAGHDDVRSGRGFDVERGAGARRDPAHARGGDPFEEFIRALNDAEHEPQLKFVSLKWFRDTYIVKCGYPWAHDPDLPRQMLQDATEQNLVLTSKVPNPKQPTFPVTSIHLNHEHPDVRRILGHGSGQAERHHH